MKGSSVRGTPIRSNTVGNEGQAAGKPAGLQGTQPAQFTSDKRGYQSNSSSGTPYTSREGNGATSKRVVQAGMTKGLIPDHTGQVPNSPDSNGDGIVFDGAADTDHSPNAAPQFDSPVPAGAPRFNPADMDVENRSHLGSNNAGGMLDLVNSTGVMGRGMDTVSQAGNKDERELTRDDTLTGKITKSDI